GLLASKPITPNALGVPGFRAKSSISLWSSTPVPGATMPEPYSRLTVWVTEARLPCASMIEKCVVSSSSSGAGSPESRALGVAFRGWMPAQAGGGVGAGQAHQRHLHEVWIAQVDRAVTVGAAHRFGDQVDALRRLERHQIPALQRLQD